MSECIIKKLSPFKVNYVDETYRKDTTLSPFKLKM